MPGAAEEKRRSRPAADAQSEDEESVPSHPVGPLPSEGKPMPSHDGETGGTSVLLEKPLDGSKQPRRDLKRERPHHDEQAVAPPEHATREDGSTASSATQLSTNEAYLLRDPQDQTHLDARAAADRERRRRNAVRTRQLKKQRIQALREKLDYFSKKESELTQENEVLRAQIKILRSLRTEAPEAAEAPLGSNAGRATTTTTEDDRKRAAVPRTGTDQGQPPQLDAQTAASIRNNPQLPGRANALPIALPAFSQPGIGIPATSGGSVQHAGVASAGGSPSFDALLASFLVLRSGDTTTQPTMAPASDLVARILSDNHANQNARILPPYLSALAALTTQNPALHVLPPGYLLPTNMSAEELKNYIISMLLQNMMQQPPPSAPPP